MKKKTDKTRIQVAISTLLITALQKSFLGFFTFLLNCQGSKTPNYWQNVD